MVPAQFGDTAILDTPEDWLGRPIDQIVDYRFSLVRSHSRMKVVAAANPGRLLSSLQELAMAAKPVDSARCYHRLFYECLDSRSSGPAYSPQCPV